jgi:type IV pilus assembly protein PilM
MKTETQWFLQIGSQRLIATHWSFPSKEKPVLQRLFVSEINWDRKSSGTLATAVAAGLAKLPGDMRAARDISLVVNGFSGLAKLIEIPSVPSERRATAFEQAATSNIPYALEDVYHANGMLADDGVEIKLLLASVQKEGLATVLHHLQKTGYRPKFLGHPSVMEMAALEALGSLQESASGRKKVGILHLGERTTHLILQNGKDLFLRVLNLGGELLIQSVSDQLGLSSAEAIHLVNRLLANDLPPEGNPHTDLLRKQATQYLQKVEREVMRTLATVRRQNPGIVCETLLLSGAFAHLPGLASTLAPKSVPEATIADSRPLFTTTPDLDQSDLQLFIAELLPTFGLATATSRHTSTTSSQSLPLLNLLPLEMIGQQRHAQRLPWILGAAASLALASLIFAYGAHQRTEDLRQTQQHITRSLAPLQQLAADIQTEHAKAVHMQASIQRLENVLNSRYNWINFFVDLQERLIAVEDVWLEDFKILPPLEVAQTPASVTALENTEAAWDEEFNGEEESAERPPVDPAPTIRLRLTGRMVDRANPLEKASPQMRERVNQLLDAFARSVFISSVDNKKFDTSADGILGFEFDIRLNPQNPL